MLQQCSLMSLMTMTAHLLSASPLISNSASRYSPVLDKFTRSFQHSGLLTLICLCPNSVSFTSYKKHLS